MVRVLNATSNQGPRGLIPDRLERCQRVGADARILEPVECVHVWATWVRQAQAASAGANYHLGAMLSDRSWHPELYRSVYDPLMEDARALAAELAGLRPEFGTLAALLA